MKTTTKQITLSSIFFVWILVLENRSEKNEGPSAELGEPVSRDVKEAVSLISQNPPKVQFDGQKVKWDDRAVFSLANSKEDQDFARYLNQPETDSQVADDYNGKLSLILEKLDPMAAGYQDPQKILKAVLPIMQEASRLKVDGGQCKAIYNTMANYLQAIQRSDLTKQKIKALLQKKDQLEWNIRMSQQKFALDNSSDMRGKDVQAAFYLKEYGDLIAEMEGIIEADSNNVKKSKVRIQENLQTLWQEKLFDHVLIGVACYRIISEGEDDILILKKSIDDLASNLERLSTTNNVIEYNRGTITKTQKVESLAPQASEALGAVVAEKAKTLLNSPTTVSEFEIRANQELDRCRRVVEVAIVHCQRKELNAAFEALLEAFRISERASPITSFPFAYKNILWNYRQKAESVKSALGSKDFGRASELITEINSLTIDSPFITESSEIGNVQSVSNIHLAKAKEAASRGDREKMEKELESAAIAWPQNPDLARLGKEILEKLDQVNIGKEDLRKLVAQKNFEAIYADKARFLAAAAGDEKLLIELNRILEKEGKIKAQMAKIEELLQRNDPAGAWESADTASKDEPSNAGLLQLLNQASSKCPEFVKKIDDARSLTAKNENASALTAFLSARKLYPSSLIAKKGIEDLSQKLLKE